MNRHEHPTDEYVRRLPLVSDEQARLLSDRDAKQALFQEITHMPPQLVDRPTATGRRMPRRTFVLAATLAVLSLATIAGAVVYFTATSTTSVGCHTPDGGVSVADAVTGDPVVDCARIWEQQTGTQAPELVAYDNGGGGIEVVPATKDVPAGWQPLDPGVAQDPAVIELERALGDYADGLNADCFSLPDARAVVGTELERLGLADWGVSAERGEADGTDSCTSFYLDTPNQEVVLIPSDGLVGSDDAPYAVFARELGEALDDGCVSLSAAADLTRRVASDTNIDVASLVIYEVSDDGARCTRADVNVGGRIEVTLRGPSA